MTAQWLPNWSRGLLRVQRNEQLATALDRLVLDLGAAEYVSARDPGRYLFEGDESSVSFVRTTLGPNDRVGLDYVRYSEAANSLGRALVRARAPFTPLAGDDRIAFADPVVLLRAPYHIVFAYTGLDGVWKNSWQGTLPWAIRLSVLDTSTQRLLPVSTAVRPHITIPAPMPEQTETPPAAPAGEARAK
jgi:general secretion pathway protein J